MRALIRQRANQRLHDQPREGAGDPDEGSTGFGEPQGEEVGCAIGHFDAPGELDADEGEGEEEEAEGWGGASEGGCAGEEGAAGGGGGLGGGGVHCCSREWEGERDERGAQVVVVVRADVECRCRFGRGGW